MVTPKPASVDIVVDRGAVRRRTVVGSLMKMKSVESRVTHGGHPRNKPVLQPPRKVWAARRLTSIASQPAARARRGQSGISICPATLSGALRSALEPSLSAQLLDV